MKNKIIDKYLECSKLLIFNSNSVNQRFTNTGADDNNFSVVFEIIVLNQISEDDYGLVFSTTVSRNKRLYLISDVCFGNGEIIAETSEIEIDSNFEWMTEFELFLKSQIENVPEIMKKRYSIEVLYRGE